MGFEAWEAHLAVREWKYARVDCQNGGFSCFSCDQSRTKAISERSRNSHETGRSGPVHSECCPLSDSSPHDIASSEWKDLLQSDFTTGTGLDLNHTVELSYLSGFPFPLHCPASCSNLGLKSARNCSSPGIAKCPSECRTES